MQRPLSPLVYALDLKSRAFWFFIFTDEKGTPVKIGTTYSLCLKNKKKTKGEKGRQAETLAERARVGFFLFARETIERDPLARKRDPGVYILLYIFVQKQIGTR